MAFYLGPRSLLRLRGVHADLVAVTKLAIKLTPVDFTVLEGVRTLAQQRIYYERGSSWTMKSRHLTGHAVDCGVLDRGKVTWHWDDYHRLADAFLAAAVKLSVPITWGGAFGLRLNDYPDAVTARDRYIDNRRKLGLRVLSDGPHFELSGLDYPTEGTLTSARKA